MGLKQPQVKESSMTAQGMPVGSVTTPASSSVTCSTTSSVTTITSSSVSAPSTSSSSPTTSSSQISVSILATGQDGPTNSSTSESSSTAASSLSTSDSGDTESYRPSDDDTALEEDDVDNFGTIPSHVDFIKMVRAAKIKADLTKVKVPINWRGYKTCIMPDLPPFTVEALRSRLLMALKSVFNMSGAERQVRIFICCCCCLVKWNYFFLSYFVK